MKMRKLNRLLLAIDTSKNLGKRDYLLINLLYDSGVRVSELINIRINNIDFENRLTANGEIFCQNKYTAAHLTYKFGTLLLVTDIATKKWVIVRVNDRCPKRNILDLSKIAAKQIGINISFLW